MALVRTGARARPDQTRAALIRAARLEFDEHGYDATNSNRIAARAGFAPQTFYRHFKDKIEVFLAVYAHWVEEEIAALARVQSAAVAARIVIGHHRGSLNFRRALRRLSVENDEVRAARATSRKQQIAQIRARRPQARQTTAVQCGAWLLMVERLADAAAEGEFADLGLTERDAEAALTELLAVFSTPTRPL